MSKVDLEALETLEKAATPARWQVLHTVQDIYGSSIMDYNWGELLRMSSYGLMREDASLISAMRNALPAMIAELRAARKVVELAKAWKSSHLSVDEIHLFKAIEQYDEAVK